MSPTKLKPLQTSYFDCMEESIELRCEATPVFFQGSDGFDRQPQEFDPSPTAAKKSKPRFDKNGISIVSFPSTQKMFALRKSSSSKNMPNQTDCTEKNLIIMGAMQESFISNKNRENP